MEAKPAPLQQEGGAGFVEVEQQSDPVVTFLSRLGVVEADKVAASLRRQHLDEASLTALEADDAAEVLECAKRDGITIGDRAKLKVALWRVPSAPAAHAPHSAAPPNDAPSPAPAPAATTSAPAASASAPPNHQPGVPGRKRGQFVAVFESLATKVQPMSAAVIEFMDGVAQQYIAPALADQSFWPRLLIIWVVFKALRGMLRRKGSSAIAAFLVGAYLRQGLPTVVAEPVEATEPTP